MTDTLANVTAPPAPQPTSSPLHAPATDNRGNILPPLEAHTQKPDAPAPRAGVISDNAYHSLPAEDRVRYAAIRKPGDQGGSEWVERAKLGGDDRANPGDPPAPTAPQGEKVRVGEYEITADELGAMMQRQAVEDQRRLTLPATPEAYEAKLPADFKAPGGIEYKFDVNDPSLIAARNLAAAKGWSQQDFSDALGIFASHQAQQEAVLQERSRAEIAKAGINAPQRVDAVGKWITAEMGEADGRPIRATIVTDAHLRFYEKLMTRTISQGTAPFSQQHRDRPAEKGFSEEQWQAMTPAAKLDYTRQFDQKQFSNQR